MALQTTTTIKIGEILITNFDNLKIIQNIHDHHTFSVELRQDLFVEELKSVMPFSQQLYGEKVSIEIKPIEGIDDLLLITNPNDYILQFYGLVTEVKLQKSTIKDMEETILIKGKSSSIVLENGADCNSFSQMSIADIANKVKSGYDIDMDVRPFYKDALPYTVQYNESNFSFLNRLAKRNGEWFYYNGRTMVLGSPGGVGGQPKLVYGVNMQDFSYDMKLIPAQFKTIENDNRDGKYTTDSTLKYRKETDGFHQNFLNKSNKVFNTESVIQLNQNPAGGYGSKTSEEYTKNKMRAVLGLLTEINASSEVPGITIGNNVRISGVDIQLESSYRVTQITHSCDDGGGYENHFTAVNFNGSLFSPQTDPDLVPYCKSQTAIVTANADPDGLSGVQVQMPWQEAKGVTTPYIPLLQKYGGDARGSHIIPEIGDTVFVDFQGNNAELPIVIGTMTSRKEKSDFFDKDNKIKGWKFRYGQILKFIEKTGIWLSDPSGNELHMNEETKSTTLTVPETLTLNCKNLIINASESITTTAGMNIFESVGVDKTTSVGMMHNLNIGGNSMLNVTGNFFENIDGDVESQTAKDRIVNSQQGIQTSSEEGIKKHSQKETKLNSGEKSNLF